MGIRHEQESRHRCAVTHIIDRVGHDTVLRLLLSLALLLLCPRLQVRMAGRVVSAPDSGHLHHKFGLGLRLLFRSLHLSTTHEQFMHSLAAQAADGCCVCARTDPRSARCSFSFCQTAASPPSAYLTSASASAATAASTVSNVPIGRICFFVEPVGTCESRA